MVRALLSFGIVTQANAVAVNAVCECGYTINATNSSSYATFTEVFETDFLHLDQDALSYSNREQTGWSLQVYNMSAHDARGPYGKEASASNVIINPMKSQHDWAGDSVLGGEGGLQVWVRSQAVNNLIPMGEMVSTRLDMLYGSFRIGVKMTGTPGTCGAFFWFRNDSQEIDLEYLSWQQSPNATSNKEYHPLNLVVQSPASAAVGYNAAGTADFITQPLPFTLSEGFHEYRFDWTHDKISFYADGEWLADMTDTIPTAPGKLFLNHWSNGDPGWSGGPPKQDAVMIVSYVKAYFNTTNADQQEDYNKQCLSKYKGIDALDHLCQIPDQTVAPDPSGPNGNKTAKTFFFTEGNVPAGANTTGSYKPHNNGTHKKSTGAYLEPAVWSGGIMTVVLGLFFVLLMELGGL